MSPSKPCIVAALALVIVLALSSVVYATVVTTCKAAAGNDKHVNYDFCVLELSMHHDSPDADTWGLAKVATRVGAVNAGDAVYDIKAMLAKPVIDDKTTEALAQCQKLYHDVDFASTEALAQCQKLYHDVDFAFLRAHDTINSRNYGGGKEQVGLAISLAHQCDDIFAKAAIQ